MNFTHPAGAWLTVGELRAALADLDERTPIKLDINDAQIGVAKVVASRLLVEIVANDLVLDTDALDLLAEIAEGGYTLRQAKEQARVVLAAAGIEVRA